MASMLKSLRLAADPNRIRILFLLEKEELSVAEIQEILAKGQSHISTHLAQLKQAGLVDDRRTGKNAFYKSTAPPELLELLHRAKSEVPEADQDREALRLGLGKGGDTMRGDFRGAGGEIWENEVAPRTGEGEA